MENVNLKINGLNVTAPAGSTILEAGAGGGDPHPHAVLFKRDQRDRRMPYVCGRSKRSKKSGGSMCLPGVRGHGSADKYEETDGFQKKDAGTSPVQP